MDIIESVREELTQRPSNDQVLGALEDRLSTIDSQKQSILDRANNDVNALEETRDLITAAISQLTPVTVPVVEEAQG